MGSTRKVTSSVLTHPHSTYQIQPYLRFTAVRPPTTGILVKEQYDILKSLITN